ncbi:hypothetical protein [Sphingobacterium suaedae]|uniref:Uncharacterized protein n=1 Tax=Sphingobacterium suaedae TaxID=1686402 RepID=A0ABW5KD60_9SPHI
MEKTILRAVVAVAFTASLLSCHSSNTPATQKEMFVDLPHFFEEEVQRLTTENPEIQKTVTKDSISETKTLRVDNWKNELSSFASVDLNKSAYLGYLEKDSTTRKVTFRSTNPKIDLSSVELTYGSGGELQTIVVHRTIKNSLYETKEVLRYIKDSTYSLEKNQSVLLMNDKYYQIEGTLIATK